MKELRVILLVDASSEDRTAVKKVWEEEQTQIYEILEAENSREATEVLRERRDVDIIFLDIILPETDGINFLSRIKKGGEYSHIPVVVNTYPGKNVQVEKALLLGAEDFILKPYHPEVLKKRISSVLNRNLQDRDVLTNLYPSQTFYNQTKRMLLHNPDTQFAMLYFNIKGFTVINDFYGNEKGDVILLELAQALREWIGRNGTYGRIIADNFVCCIPSASEDEEIQLFRYVEERMEELRRIYHFNLECGIYKIDDINLAVSIMCDRAKFSMINIRKNRGEKYAYYDADLARQYRNEQRIVADMEQALAERQFFIMLHPIYDAATESPVSAEALVRWKHPELGIIRPDIFVPLFEKNGFIRQLDLYVWEEVCKLLAKMLDDGNYVCPVSVNVSRIDLYDPEIGDAIEQMLEQYNVPKRLLRLEITESAYTEKPREIIELVSKLRNRGFELLMDDFGSGYSSLNMLKEMDIDTLKIDMQFMEELATSRRAGNILISIVRMAKLLNISTVAEGVETREQMEFLRNAGCDRIQGYYFSRPLSAEEYEKLMAEEALRRDEKKPYKKGVLLVDDVTMLRKSLIQALGDSYQYFEAANGKEALEVLNEYASKIGIIITDIFMPEMDGFELIQKLKQNSVFSHIPIIVITASEERENEIRALRLGAVDVATKPYDPVIVSHRVKNVMKMSETEWLQMEMQLMQSGILKGE